MTWVFVSQEHKSSVYVFNKVVLLKIMAVLMPVAEDVDLEGLVLACSSKFRVILEKSREQVTAGRAIGKEEILKRLKN
jgi:hypothetical protein